MNNFFYFFLFTLLSFFPLRAEETKDILESSFLLKNKTLEYEHDPENQGLEDSFLLQAIIAKKKSLSLFGAGFSYKIYSFLFLEQHFFLLKPEQELKKAKDLSFDLSFKTAFFSKKILSPFIKISFLAYSELRGKSRFSFHKKKDLSLSLGASFKLASFVKLLARYQETVDFSKVFSSSKVIHEFRQNSFMSSFVFEI